MHFVGLIWNDYITMYGAKKKPQLRSVRFLVTNCDYSFIWRVMFQSRVTYSKFLSGNFSHFITYNVTRNSMWKIAHQFRPAVLWKIIREPTGSKNWHLSGKITFPQKLRRPDARLFNKLYRQLIESSKTTGNDNAREIVDLENQERSVGPLSLVFCFRSLETNGSAFPGYNTPLSDNHGESFGFRHSRLAATCPIRGQNAQDVPRFPAQRRQFVTKPAEYWL